MKNINNFIFEKLKINSKSKVNTKDNNWSIEKAENGDIVSDGDLLFIYKCLRKDCQIKYNNASPNAIVYQAIYFTDSDRIEVKIDTGVGTTYNDYYELATDEQCELFYKALEKKGYKWDNNKKEVVKL